MATTCTRCQGTGFLNIDQIIDLPLWEVFEEDGDHKKILRWIASNNGHDVQVCDCCGNGEEWYGVPGEHYNEEDPIGHNGPYAYNGGLCECH